MANNSLLFLILASLLLSGFFTKTSSAFSIEEATIDDLQLAFKQNHLTSRQLVEFYLKRIRRLNPLLRGVIEVNPDALFLADKADRERKVNTPGSTGGLHGIPILLKDNIATKDKLNTTAGSYALLGSVVPRDAGVVMKLRKAGAIILGKSSLSEWANFRTNDAPSGFCGRSGQGKNPYVLSASPCGSSSGSGISVAANLAAVSLGTETDGSILCPSSYNSVVGIKPTVGLTSRSGVIPISPRQDTVGRQGAVLVDNLQISDDDTITAGQNGEILALLLEFKPALNEYLEQLVASPVRSLAAVIAFNKKFSRLEKTKEYGQERFEKAEFLSRNITNIDAILKKLVSTFSKLSKNGLEKLIKKNKLDALVAPDFSGVLTFVLAIGQYPGISVPAGYDSDGVPFGISFGGPKGSEPKLIEIAYGFETATKVRRPPAFKP
ncbi:amidase [Populus alba x Populus x berolinensis]|nr:amidase [Populus alba x Populus x berolinensis]